MPNGNTAGAERQYRAMDGAVPNRDTEGANRRDYSWHRMGRDGRDEHAAEARVRRGDGLTGVRAAALNGAAARL